MKRRFIDAAAVGGLGLLVHLIACRFWGAHRAGAVDPFGYAGGSGRCPPKSFRTVLLLALISGPLLAGVQVYTRNIELGELPDRQGGLAPAAENARC